MRFLKLEDRVVIWLEYFNAPSRSKGRRVPKLNRTVTLEELMRVARELGLEPEPLNKRYPRTKREGAILVKKKASKQKIIKMIYEFLLKKAK
ncbi:MAG: signal recognition particle subunit SRP19/SEC65 family protein [Thermoprotei archaeon]